AAGSSWIHHSSVIFGINFDFTFPIFVGIILIAIIWIANVFGVRPAVWVGYITGALLLVPLAVLIFLPYITGDWSSSNLHNLIDWGNFGTYETKGSGNSLIYNNGWRLVITWLYLMCWSSYGFECCASFAPEYHDPERDTAKALRAAAVFGVFVYALLPIGALGTFGDQNITINNTLTFYGDTFSILLGGTMADILVIMLCAGIVLSMNTATMDGSRALYGISQDGMTIRWLGKLNRNNVPGNAMTLDALLNMVLLFIAIGALAGGGYLKILAVSNFGYVIAHIFAISGFLLLRKDRPGWPRPIRLGPIWTWLAVLCLVLDIVYLVVGSISFNLTGYAGGSQVFVWGLIVLVVAIALYIYRVVVEDKAPLRWRLPAPSTPAEEQAGTPS
ncbi:MAG TPA: APC family permease, partial [Gaiellales bacterium]|nr:APC family permease [Gaiellales bacterium]